MHKSKILLNIKKYTQNKTNKKKKIPYQFSFNGDFKQIDSSLLTSILIMFIYLGFKGLQWPLTLVLQASESHLLVFSVWNPILWHGLQLTGSPSLQAHNF